MSATSTTHIEEDFRGTERFAVVRRLGAGGMGVVYRAHDRQRDVDVALKTLRRLSATAIYALKQEFRSLADVHHPNLVALHELVSEGGQWFFTMELVEGCDFLEHVRSGDVPPPSETLGAEDSPLRATESHLRIAARALGSPPPRASRVRLSSRLDLSRLRHALRQLTEGVIALHHAGKLHRDIKPSNVMVDHAGRVVLLDFGLASDLRAAHEGDRTSDVQSAEQHALGTPEYMSPEQGGTRPLGPASDWYSVGVMLFEALTGGLPFVGGPIELLTIKGERDGPAPSDFVEGVPEDLDALCAELLRRKPAARPSGEDLLRRLEPAESSSGPMPVSMRSLPPPPQLAAFGRDGDVPLIGRGTHLETLQGAFATTRRARATLVHVHGTTGHGKSALVRRFVDWAVDDQRAVALVGRCYERESVPYKALDGVIDALSRWLRRRTRLQVEAVLPRDVRALARVFPVLYRVEAIAAAPRLAGDQSDAKDVRRRAFAALRELLARIADRKPLVIVIDDLQWGDTDSMSLLVDVLRPPSPPPLMLIASYRTEDRERSPALLALRELEPPTGVVVTGRGSIATPVVDLRSSTTSLRRIRIDTACEVLRLEVGRLTDDDARGLVRTLLEREPAQARKHEETIVSEADGSPFLVLELVRHLHDAAARGDVLPQKITLEHMIATRLATLSDDARRLLEVVSVAGQPLSPEVARKAAGIESEAPAVSALRGQQLLRTVQTGDTSALETHHDRIREGVVARLDVKTLAGHHRALAQALEADARPDPEAICTHHRAAGDDAPASRFAAIAAERAIEMLAFERAVTLYRLAIELAQAGDPDVRSHRVKLAQALVDCGRSAEAAHEYLAAAAGADHDETLDLHRRAAEQMLLSGHIDEGLSVIGIVLEALGTDLAKTPRRALASIFFKRTQVRFRGLSFKSRPASEVPAADLTRIDTYWSLGIGLSIVDTIRAVDFHTRQLLLSLRAGEPYRVARAIAAEAAFIATAGGASATRTRELVVRAGELAKQTGDPHALGLAAGAAGYEAYHQGRWKAARALLEHAEKFFREHCSGVGWELASILTFWTGAASFLGDLAAVSERIPPLLDEGERRGDRFLTTNLRLGHASILWLADDDPDGGRRDAADAIASWSQRGFHVQHYYALLARMQCDLYAGDGAGALRRIDRAWNELDRSLLLRLQRLHIEALHLRGRCALAAARDAQPSARKPLLRRVARDAAQIEGEKMPWGNALAALLRAGIAKLEGDDEKTLARLRSAKGLLGATDLSLHAAAAEWLEGAALEGAEGVRLQRAAVATFAKAEVANARRMIALLAPGFG